MKIFVLNCGSSTLKFQLIDMENEERIVKGNYERIGGKNSSLRLNVRGEKHVIKHFARNYKEALDLILSLLTSEEYKAIKSLDEIKAVGHRIVHGGEIFSKSVIITDEVIEQIEKCIPLAPLHNPEGIAGIRAMQSELPNVPMVAVFDTAFHQTLSPEVYTYQIPYRYYEDYHIRKYGFHGTSHRYVSNRAEELIGKRGLKIINCHLGQGASICAINAGKSVDTTMGLTPMSGIPMATRCGDIDPSVVTYIMKCEDLTIDQVERILNKKSGAWGVSGVSEDYRDIERAYFEKDERSMLALDSQSYIIAQCIGKYMVSLGGLDAITFTGGVGENGIEARERICKHLEFLGLKLYLEKNNIKGEEACISKDDSKIKVYVIPTNEELMIARDTYDLLK